MKITIVGTGYVGMSLAVLLSQKNEVLAYDIDEKKVNLINNKKSTVEDADIDNYVKTKNLNLISTSNK